MFEAAWGLVELGAGYSLGGKGGSLFPILQIDSRNEIQPEGMGSKAKSWFLVPEENESAWLFKRPQRTGSGEHWAEKIAAEVAGLLGISHARVELAEFQGDRGSISENIVPRFWDLIHGNEVLESTSFFQDSEYSNFHLSDHTLENIWLALDETFGSDSDKLEARLRFAEYLVLDAVVGNTDRHSENWAILRRQEVFREVESLAPSYDHGSSLGHELMDARRERYLAEEKVGDYSEKGHGQLYWHREERRGPSPLKLVRLAFSQYPELFASAFDKIVRLRESSLGEIVDSVPGEWMAPSAKTFALEIMSYSSQKLREVAQDG